MKIAVLRETQTGETRVALVPESVRKLVAIKATVVVEAGAGLGSLASDAAYKEAGATVTTNREALLGETDVLVCVNRPPAEYISTLKPGTVVLGFLRPLDEATSLRPLVERKLTAFAVELIPRISRAQSMDGLSSMATVAGYKAVILAADRLPRMFPMLMTAASTVAPARALVLGAGVAGLQAIATARRLGAVVEAYDVRAAAGEQVRSLGATFLEVDLGGIKTEDAGGYATELSEEALLRGRNLIAERARVADFIITTAQVPGRRAPLLITKEAAEGMKRGSLIVDLAASTGGNCALTQPGIDVILENGVTIMAPLNLTATVPVHASQMYSHNVTAFLGALIKDGEVNVNLSDPVLGPACVCHGEEYLHPRVAAALNAVAGVIDTKTPAVPPLAADPGGAINGQSSNGKVPTTVAPVTQA